MSQQTRVNIASFLSQIFLPDALEESLLVKEGVSDTVTFGGAIAGVFASIPGLGTPVLAALIVTTGAGTLAAYLSGLSTTRIRNEADNAYWLRAKQQLFCNLPDDDQITPQVQERLAQSIENIVPFNGREFGWKANVNGAVAAIIRDLSTLVLQEIATSASIRWIGDPNGCDFCYSPYTPIPVDGFSITESVSDTIWKLKVSAKSGQLYTGKWRTQFKDDCLRISKATPVIAPQITIGGNPVLGVGTAKLCGSGTIVNLTNLASMVGLCVSELEIQSSSPFEFYVTLDDCNSSSLPQGSYVQFEQFSQTMPEGGITGLRVRLYTDEPLQNAVTVNVNAVPAQGTDFTYTPTQVTFPVGSQNADFQNVSITALSDSVDEGNENVVFTLANATGGAQIGLPNTHVVTITNQWEHVFDFTQDDGDFSTCPMPEAPVSRGVYVAGTGWRTTPFNDNQMDSFVIGRNLPNTVSTPLTSITVETSDGVHYAAFYNRNAWIPIGERNAQNTADKTTVSAIDTLSGLQMVLTNGFAIDFYSPDGSQRTLTRLTLRGTGSNPFV